MLNVEMNARFEERRAPVHIPAPIGLLLMPVLLIVGALSYPIIGVLFVYFKIKERRFVQQMTSLNRVMDWDRFLRSEADNHGTVIVEWLSEKGPVRRWWTADDIRKIVPHGLPENGMDAVFDRQFDPFCLWCYETYTNNRTGKALLLASSHVPELWNRTENLISTITLPVIATAATTRQRSSWAKP